MKWIKTITGELLNVDHISLLRPEINSYEKDDSGNITESTWVITAYLFLLEEKSFIICDGFLSKNAAIQHMDFLTRFLFKGE